MEAIWFEHFMKEYHEEMAYRNSTVKNIVTHKIQNVF